MRYASIRPMDVTNGYGIGVALFTQGCPHHCPFCFNPETWNMGCNAGKEWTPEVEEEFMALVKKDHIVRVSFLGGEPLIDRNLETLLCLAKKIAALHRKIYVWTGYTLEELKERDNPTLNELLKYIDVLVDGRFVFDLRDPNLELRGSSNQRILYLGKDY